MDDQPARWIDALDIVSGELSRIEKRVAMRGDR